MQRRGRVAPLVVVLALLGTTEPVALPAAAAVRLKEAMTAAEFERCGLNKLTPPELAALEEWFADGASNWSTGAAPRGAVRPGAAEREAPSHTGEIVALNTSNGKYHCLSCQWAVRCTRNCVSVPLSEAKARGVPCKVCGGSCR